MTMKIDTSQSKKWMGVKGLSLAQQIRVARCTPLYLCFPPAGLLPGRRDWVLLLLFLFFYSFVESCSWTACDVHCGARSEPIMCAGYKNDSGPLLKTAEGRPFGGTWRRHLLLSERVQYHVQHGCASIPPTNMHGSVGGELIDI